MIWAYKTLLFRFMELDWRGDSVPSYSFGILLIVAIKMLLCKLYSLYWNFICITMYRMYSALFPCITPLIWRVPPLIQYHLNLLKKTYHSRNPKQLWSIYSTCFFFCCCYFYVVVILIFASTGTDKLAKLTQFVIESKMRLT